MIYFVIELHAIQKVCSYSSKISYIACLLDQNKSGFFGVPAFFQPIRAFW